MCILTLALGLGLGLGLSCRVNAAACPTPSPASSVTPSDTHSSPSSAPIGNAPALTVGATWDYALGYTVTTSNANASTHFYSTDMVDTPQSTISGLQSAGHFVACYFSAGSVESYRADAKDFPPAAVGKRMAGWPDEKWVDTRNAGVRAVMTARIARAQSKGCDGIDADNVDGYSNDTGFNMTADDGVDYVRFLANATQAAGMLYGLKNAGDIVHRVVDVAAWNIQEQCVVYHECAGYAPFIHQGKPVFHVEYTDTEAATSVNASFRASSCGAGGHPGFSSIIKHLSLDNWVVDCS